MFCQCGGGGDTPRCCGESCSSLPQAWWVGVHFAPSAYITLLETFFLGQLVQKHVKTLQHTTMCHCTRSVEGVASIEQLSRLQCAGYFRPRDLCTQKFLLMEVAFIEGRKKLSLWGCLVVRRLCVFFPDPTLMGIYDVAEAAA